MWCIITANLYQHNIYNIDLKSRLVQGFKQNQSSVFRFSLLTIVLMDAWWKNNMFHVKIRNHPIETTNEQMVV